MANEYTFLPEYLEVVAYQSDGVKRFIRGSAEMVQVNLQAADQSTTATLDAYVANDTPIEGSGTIADNPTVPTSAADYDVRYPNRKLNYNSINMNIE